MRKGTVEGCWVEDILLDTGCSRTLVHQKLVPEEAFLEGKATTFCCAHGDTVVYTLARIHIEVQRYSIDVEAAVSEDLPVGVLLGTDVSQLSELLSLSGESYDYD
jgi:predicted aspartyl protease